MNFPSQIFFNDINDGYRPAILKKLFVAASIQYGFAYLILLWKGVQNDQTSLITLNMIGYAGIYLKKKQKNCWICQNSKCVGCSTYEKVTVQITEQLSRRLFRTLLNI